MRNPLFTEIWRKMEGEWGEVEARPEWRNKVVMGIFGSPPPDQGELFLNGKKMHFREPKDALTAGEVAGRATECFDCR
jgi:hypothetical protein